MNNILKLLPLFFLTSCVSLENLQKEEPSNKATYNANYEKLIECTKQGVSFDNLYNPYVDIAQSPDGALILAPIKGITYVGWSAEFKPLGDNKTEVITRDKGSLIGGSQIPKNFRESLLACDKKLSKK